MKLKNSFLILLGFLLSYSFSPISLSSPSIEWQKIELEKSINQRVNDSLSPILKSGEFIINTQITLTPGTDLKVGAGGGNGGSDEKKEVRPTVKFTDIDPSLAKGDYVVLSKLGLEAPIFKEKNPEKAEAPKSNSEAGEWQKFLKQYLEVHNLSKYVSKITINIKLDNYLDEETKKTVEETLNSLGIEFGTIKSEIKISFIAMKEMKKEIAKIKEQKNREMFEWLGKLGSPIGILLAVIILGVFAWMIFKKYAELQEKQLELLKNQAAAPARQELKEEDKEKAKDKDTQPENKPSLATPGTEVTIDRFRAILENNNAVAMVMIKSWINEPSKNNHLALKCLVQELNSTELSDVFIKLTLEERKYWKKVITKPLKQEESNIAKLYIENQVIQEMIIPNSIDDVELIELLLKVSPEDCVELSKVNENFGPFIMNVMNPKFISKMISLLSSDEMQKILTGSLAFTNDNLIKYFGEIKLQIKAILKTEPISPMVEKIAELIPVSGLNNERTLYSVIAKAGNVKLLTDIARNFIPGEVIFNLPNPNLKTFIQSYPRDKRVELILVSEEALKARLMELVAPNQKAKDVLGFDLQKYEVDSGLKNKILNEKENLKLDFVNHCRKQIGLNPTLIQDLEPFLVTWIETLGFESHANKTQLKVA